MRGAPGTFALKTRRLSLTQLTAEDAPFILKLVNDPDWLRYIGDRNVHDLDDARRYIADGPAASYAARGFGLWRVALRETDTPIGLCGLLQRETLPAPDLGFAFLPQHRRAGFGREAASAVLQVARTLTGTDQLYAVVQPDNTPSLSLLASLGFRPAGTTRLVPDGMDLHLLAVALPPVAGASWGRTSPRPAPSTEVPMTALTALWLPILLSGVIVFFASSIIHMVLPWHKNDFATLPDEEKVRAALGPLNIPPGDYMVPKPSSMEELKSPAFVEKHKAGPVVMMTVMPPGPMTMGPALFWWFIFCLVVSALAAYAAGLAIAPGAGYMTVFRMVSTVAFIGYGIGNWPNTIWYKRNPGTMIKGTIDALVYGLLTAGVFGWLWPRG